MKIIRAPGGSARREVELSKIQIPDLWPIAIEVGDRDSAAETAILECWHLAHDLLYNLKQAEPVLEMVAREQHEEARPSDVDPLSGPEGD